MVKLTKYNESNRESSHSLRSAGVKSPFTPGGSKVVLYPRLYDTATGDFTPAERKGRLGSRRT